MPRFKSRKDYAIKLTHKDIGVFYFKYCNEDYWNWNRSCKKYMFTQDLNKVKTWKTLKGVEEQIKNMKSYVKIKGNDVFIPFGKVKPTLPESISTLLMCERKRYFLKINKFNEIHTYKTKENSIKALKKLIIEKSLTISKEIEEEKFDHDNFLHKKVDQLKKYLLQYAKDRMYILEHKLLNDVVVDVVDASYNFRALKLKKLQALQK